MVEHAWRRILFILILIGLGITFLLSNGIRLGLDLQGGSRLVYRVDLDKLSAQTASEGTKKELSEADRTRIMDETLLIISQRIDPRGTTDANITVAGSERLLIELPGMEEHELDQVVRRIKTLGKLDMRMVVERDYLGGFFEMDQERERLEKWLKKPEVKDEIARDPLYIQRFNEMAGTDEGPKNKYLKWFPMKRRENPNWDKKTPETRWLWERSSIPDETQHYLPINYHEKVHFTGEDIDSKTIRPGINQRDNTPALNYEIVPGRKGEYADWSDVYTKKHSAIILNDYVEIAPVFNERIPGNVQVSGNFKKEEVDELVIVLKTGSLKIVPELESRSSIGATLGQLAIDKGKFSIMLGGLLIVFFMMVYYRWAAGSIACLSLLVNLFLVFGGIALIKATLTLPGLAGIVLTIGMAVDANILIFERIREEKDRGKDLKRSVEAGFERAMSTILDANITTFLTGLILYNVGIGPIRGFAVTLMFGIVTSVFSALYVSKTIFHLLIAGERIKQLSMSRLFATPDLNLLRFRSLTTLLSIVAVALGLFWFFQTPPAGKYGIDFTGGAVVRARMREPMAQQEI
ncbi:MAG: protein translocase subunit SecD, partial [Planctomycetota bacterium]